MPTEGQTAVGPNGQRATYRGGQWVVMPGAPQMPADPTFPYQGAKAAADLANVQGQAADRAEDNARADRSETRQLAAVNAQLYGQGLMIGPDGVTPVPIPNWTAPLTGAQSEERKGKISRLNQLIAQANRVQELYEAGPGSTKGIPDALADYFPSDANSAFDTAGASLSQQGLAAFRVPGTGTVSDRDAEMFDRANLPTSWTRDVSIEEQLRGIRSRVDEELQVLGLPPAPWTGAVAPAQEERPNPLTAVRVGGSGSGPGAAAFGATTGNTATIPPELSAEHDALVAQLMQQGGGRIDPDAYVQAMGALTTKYPSFGITPETSAQWARDINTYLDAGGKTVPGGMQLEDRPLSMIEQGRNSLVSNPLGAAAAGFADMGGFGGVSALAPQQMAALSGAQPLPMALGQVGGAIGGTAALGALGRNTLGRALPQTMGGAGGARFGRNLATDAAYSGIYGGVTDGDPLTGAALGAVGSVGGQAIGNIAGRAVSGVTSSPTVSRLYSQGVVPTLGQIMRGRAVDNGGKSLVAGIEDVVANNGAVGTFVNAGRGRALEQANLAGFNIASGGRPVTEIGEAGLSQLDTIKDTAYSDALNGVSMPINDPNFVRGVANASRRGEAVDAARGRGDFTYIMDNDLAPILNTPNISGPQFQDALRLLQGQSRAYGKAAGGAAPDPAAAGVSRALDEVSGALTDLAGNYSPDTIPRLQEANSIYRNFRVLDDAAERGRNEGGTFTGAQLGDAIGKNNAQFGQRGFLGRSTSPLNQLQQDMTAVLPNKVPPTGVNAAPMLALGGAAMGGAGVATDNDYLKAIALLGLGALPYTRGGQRATAAALLNRGPRAQMLGRAIRNRAGLFGSAALPSLIAD